MRKLLRLSTFALVTCCVFTGALGAQRADFRIVVLEGEDATNIIQPRTAVAPVIEVRDKNDQPVAGVVVTFGIRRGSASFANGARTMIATTDASGRAVGAGLTATSKGTLQLTVSARVQGQAISTTITQSNVVTAAQAAQAGQAGTSAGGASGGGTAAGGGASGSGAGTTAAVAAAGGAAGSAAGGLSGLAIAGIAAGGAGGAIATVTATRNDDPTDSTDSSTSTATTRTYAGQYANRFVSTIATAFPVNPVVCQATFDATGILRLALTVASNDTVTGTGDTSFQTTPVSQSGCPVQQIATTTSFSDTVSGTRGAFTLTARAPYSGQSHYGPTAGAATLTFSGSLANGVITGTLVFSNSGSGTSDGSNGGTAGAPITISGSVSMPVTLR